MSFTVSARFIEANQTKNLQHGHCKKGKTSPEWTVWKNMKQRCLNPRSTSFKYYGARGVTICKRWLTFTNFLADMGKRPKGKTLDRKNNNRNYTPSNCRWITPKEQAANRRTVA